MIILPARRRRIFITIIIIALLAAGGSLKLWTSRHDIKRWFERASLPAAVEYQPTSTAAASPVSSPAALPTRTTIPPSTDLPAEANLAVPFTPQAPHANWEDPYKEFCEEASSLMAAYYLLNKDIPNPESADRDLLAVKTFEEERFGYHADTTAAETAIILQEYFNIDDVTLVADPTVEDIKQAIAGGKLVIVPAAGRMLGNPYYTPPGPLYHMLVVKGYTDDGKFITNDPGTRRGADYLYEESVLMEAMHDWRPDKQIELGRKVVIIVG